MKINCIKAYDIRGELGTQLNEEIAYRIGRAYGDLYQPKTIAVGCDIRLSSESLKQATIQGLNDAGTSMVTSPSATTVLHTFSPSTLQML